MHTYDSRVEAEEPFNVGVMSVRSDQKVKVEAVLDRLGLGTRLKEDAPAGAGTVLVDGIIRGWCRDATDRQRRLPPIWMVYSAGTGPASTRPLPNASIILVLVVESTSPENRQRMEVGGVEHDLGPDGGHNAP